MVDFRDIEIAELAAIIADHLKGQGIEVVLVGGLAVEIYTENLYLTKDIDMVNINYSPPEHLKAAMAALGFYKQGRVYVNETTDITVEFPPGPLSVGDELIRATDQKAVGGKSINILKVEDAVKDRLAAFIHWRDHQSLVQATTILLKHHLDPRTFKSFCEREGEQAHYLLVEQLFTEGQRQQAETMAELESVLTQLLIRNI